MLRSFFRGSAVAAGLALSPFAGAQLVSINETFTGTTLSSGWQVGGSNYTPTLTAGTGVDTAGSGWLRLTSAGNNQATYAYDTNSFNGANATIAVKFNYAAYNGTGADGITFFLADASKTFGVGSYGGSLGYAQRTTAGGGGSDVNGMSGGYIGLGIDEFGNYSNPNEGRVGGVGFDPGNVSIRGPGSGLTGYDYLGGTGILSTPIAFSSSTTRPTGVDARTFEVVITATNQLTVYMQAGTSGAMQSLYSIDLSGYARPDDLVLGFTGSTGGSTNIHEVQGLLLTSLAARLWTNVGATSTWGSSSNWDGSSGVIPAVGSDILLDNHYVSSAQTIDVAATRSIRSLQIDAPFAYTLNNGTLQFNDQGVLGPSGIFVSQGHGAATHTINSSVIADNAIEIKNQSSGALNLTGTLANGGNTVTLSGSGTTNLSGVISGTGAIAKNDGGTAALSGNNTYTGGTILNNGTLAVGHNNALGTGVVTMTGGTLSSTAANTVANNITLQGSGGLSAITTSGTLTQSGGNYSLDMANATQSGAVNLSESNTGRTLSVNVDSGTSTISGIIQNGGTGAGGLGKTGVGTLTLSGANTYTGTTTVTGGTLKLGGNDRLADASGLNIGALGTVDLGGFSDKIGTLTGAGGASIDMGSVSGANTFIFGTYVAPSSGVLVINNWESALDKLATTVAGQTVSTIYISGYGVAQEAASTSAMGGSYGTAYLLTPVAATLKEWDGSSSATWATSANWTAPNAPGTTEIAYFNSLGTGRATPSLAADSTIAGIRFGSGASVSYNLTSTAGRTLTLSGTVPYIQQQSANAQTIAITNLALSNSTVADITGAGNLTISSVITGASAALIKDGTGVGKLILSGTNTYGGGFFLNNGTAQANNNAALGTGAATLASGSTLEIAGNRTLTNIISVGGAGVGSAGAIQSVSGNNTLSGQITESGATTFAASSGATLNLTGNLLGTNTDTSFAGAGTITAAYITTGTGAVTLDGTGTVTFNGATSANTYSGLTSVNSGTLVLAKTAGTNAIAGDLTIGDGVGAANSATVQLTNANQISDSSALTIGTDGLLNLNGQAETIGSLSGFGNINNSSATATTLTVGDTTSTTYSGIIQDTGGNLSLTKVGAGKLTLTGANTNAGAVSLSAGILAIQHNTALGSGALTVASGGNLEVSGNLTNVANAMNLNGPGTLANDGAIQSTSGSNTLSGVLTLQSATRIMADSGSTLNISNTIAGTGQALTLGGSGNINVSGTITTGAAGTLTKDGDGTVVLSGANTYTGATAINAGTLEIRSATALGTAAGGATVATDATLAVSNSITTAETPLTISGVGVGSGGALRSLSGTNTLSGAVTLNAASNVGVDAGTLTMSGVIAGAAGYDLTKVGAGTLTVSGAAANTLVGNFNVNDGTVILNKTAGIDATGNGTGSLNIGDGTGSANSAILQLAANNQINNGLAVTINADGKFDVNSKTEQIGSLAGSGSITLGTGNVLTVGNATNTTFSGAVSTTGTGAITKTGTGTLTLSETAASNSFAAATLNLTQGTVQLGASNILNTALNFNGGTFAVNGFSDTISSATLTTSSILDFNSLAGVFDVTNGLYTAGTLTINNWAGSISGGGASQLRLPGTVTGALLANINFSGYGSGAQIVNGEIVPITGTSYSWNVTGAGTWATDANWTPDPTGVGIGPNGTGTSVVFGSALTTDSSVTVAGTKIVGYMTFNDNNRYTITGGTVNLDVSTGSNQINVSNSGGGTIASAITLSDGLQVSQNSSGSFIISGGISNATGNQNISVAGSGTTNIIGAITTGTGNLTMNGTGTLTLGGANTFTGGTTVNNGIVAISSDGNLGGTTGAVTLNGGTLENTANLTLTAGRTVTLGASGGTFLTDPSTTLIYNGILAGTGALNKSGTGVFTTGGASANTQSGAVNITAGTLEIAKTANVSALGNTSAVTISAGGILKFNGTGAFVAETIGSLAGAGTVTNASANALALTTGDATSTIFAGAIQNTGGALSLIKTGTGTMTLTDTGGLSNFTGVTTVSQGVLNIQANTALGSSAAGTSVTSGAALEVQGNITVGAEALTLNGTGVTAAPAGALRNVSGNNSMSGAITLGSATTIKSEAGLLTLSGAVGGAAQNLTLDGAGNITMSGAIGTTTGTLTKNGSGYVTLSGNSTYTGATSINAGTLEIQNGNALGTAAGGATVASGATLAMSGNITSAESPLTINGVGDGSGGAIRSLSGTNTLSGAVALASSSLVGVDAGTLTVSGVVSGTTTSLTKVGSGTLVLSNTNTYDGGTSINAGTVQIGADRGLGAAPAAVSAANITMNGGTLATTYTGTLATNRGVTLATGGGTISTATATTLTYGGVVAGTGALTKTGAGTLVLTGTNTFTGATNINGGTLSISADAQLGAGPTSPTADQLTFNGGTLATTATMTLDSDRSITLNSGGGTINVANATTLTFGGTISGTGNLTLALNSTGLLDLTSDVNLSSSTLFLSGGTLRLSGADLSVGTFHITGNTILDFGTGSASSLTASNIIIDAGVSVTVNGWVNGTDYFFASSTFVQNGGPSAVHNARGSAPENQITFSGFSNNSTGWLSYDNQITPVPEPSTYGAIFIGACAGLLGWRRWRKRSPRA